uniref:(northern house mosquito) hypothetical protein n=1 Tax=Culex pipiens TaxID=7175 RepID=A0A8D8FR37_CULPI
MHITPPKTNLNQQKKPHRKTGRPFFATPSPIHPLLFLVGSENAHQTALKSATAATKVTTFGGKKVWEENFSSVHISTRVRGSISGCEIIKIKGSEQTFISIFFDLGLRICTHTHT